MVATFIHVVKNNGLLGLYSGLSASLLRQITYSTTRFGVYEELKQRLTTPSSTPSMPVLVAIASTSGFIGGVVGNPADVMNVRMQNDPALPIEKRRNYKNAIHGIVRMSKEEGIASLFRGVWPNSARAVLMTASQLATYDIFKRLLITHTPMGDDLTTHFTSSLLAGFVATTACSPFDVLKTRVMSCSNHHGVVWHFKDLWNAEGLRWCFRGWTPSFIRLGPQTIATFIFLEQHKKIYRNVKGVDDTPKLS